MKISKGTIARTVALAVTLLNAILTAAGKNPLPYSETETYEAVSIVLAVIATIVGWWKNNSFTPAAIQADKYMKELKSQSDDIDDFSDFGEGD